MSKQITFIILLLFGGILSACQSTQDSAEVQQMQQKLAAVESRLDELDQNADVSGLEAQIKALQDKIDSLGEAANPATATAEDGSQTQVFQVTMATYVLDTAGFHDLDERLNQDGVIDPGDAGVVRRAQSVLAATSWPAGLQAKADQLMGILGAYGEALANDDLEAAKPLASQAHEVQHDLSHAVENWLGGLAGEAAAGGMEHDHAEAAHMDHSPHHGGLVGMSGDLHLEIVSPQAGEYQVYLSDALRQPIDPAGVSGVLVLNPASDQPVELPLQVMAGEYLAASGGPTDVDSLDVSIRLDGTPQGHVEMDFTLSGAAGQEHQQEGEHDHDE